jgi:hypothetical protein
MELVRSVRLRLPTIFQSFIQGLKVLHYPDVFSTQTAKSMASSLGTSGIMTIEEFAGDLKVTERTIYWLAVVKS